MNALTNGTGEHHGPGQDPDTPTFAVRPEPAGRQGDRLARSLDRARWFAEARSILNEVYGPQVCGFSVLIVNEAGQKVRFTCPTAPRIGEVLVALSPLEEDILRTLAGANGGPVVAKVIARQVHRPYDSGLRAVLANLGERRPPVIVASKSGYRLAVLPEGLTPVEPRAAGVGAA